MLACELGQEQGLSVHTKTPLHQTTKTPRWGAVVAAGFAVGCSAVRSWRPMGKKKGQKDELRSKFNFVLDLIFGAVSRIGLADNLLYATLIWYNRSLLLEWVAFWWQLPGTFLRLELDPPVIPQGFRDFSPGSTFGTQGWTACRSALFERAAVRARRCPRRRLPTGPPAAATELPSRATSGRSSRVLACRSPRPRRHASWRPPRAPVRR